MKIEIETKYEIGQEVWFVGWYKPNLYEHGNYAVFHGKIMGVRGCYDTLEPERVKRPIDQPCYLIESEFLSAQSRAFKEKYEPVKEYYVFSTEAEAQAEADRLKDCGAREENR